MPIDNITLAAELARLRKGRAMRDPDLIPRLGPQTKDAFGIGDTDQVHVIRRKAAALIKERLQDRELQTAALAALALLPETDQRLLKDREAYLAQELRYDSRTVRRRVEEATKQLADACVEAAAHAVYAAPGRDDGFRVRTLWAQMRLDLPQPQLRERRLIVATAAQLEAIVGRMTVPRKDPSASGSDLDVQVRSGGTLTKVERSSAEDFAFTVKLSRPLALGDTHEYELIFRPPSDQPMRPHYVFQPLVQCDHFELTVRFDPRRRPKQIWLVDGVMPRGLDNPQPDSPTLSPSPTGILRHTFTNLRQGLSYGVRWWPLG